HLAHVEIDNPADLALALCAGDLLHLACRAQRREPAAQILPGSLSGPASGCLRLLGGGAFSDFRINHALHASSLRPSPAAGRLLIHEQAPTSAICLALPPRAALTNGGRE